MHFFGNKSLYFAVLAALFALANHLSAHAAEKYSATVEDGTAKVIRGNTAVDAAKPAEEFITSEEAPAPAPRKVAPKKLVAAPKHVSHKIRMADETITAEPTIADLKRQNGELEKRLTALEQAKAEAKADAASEQQAAGDVTEEAAQAQDVAPGAAEAAQNAAPAETMDAAQMDEAPAAPAPVVKKLAPKKPVVAAKKAAVVAAPAAAEANPIDARVSEKAATTAAVRAEQKKAAEKFDVVPDAHVAEIAQRLKYANEILKRFGRAYDYRSTTLTEFKKTLAELEQAEEKTQGSN